MAIEFQDPKLAERLNEGMNMTGEAQLPFIAPTCYFMNGSSNLKALNNALYYGGWVIKANEMEDTLRAYSLDSVPSGWTQTEINPRDGDPYQAYIARHAVVAPFALRSAWKHKKTGIIYPESKGGNYVQDTRHVGQVAAFLAEKVKDDQGFFYQSAFPVVLSTKGFQVKHLRNALSAWDKYTAQARKQYAPLVPSWCFWIALGTFGDFKQVQVGNGEQKSPITPITPYLPEKITEETLDSLFVGEAVAISLADMIEDSKEWVEAWKSPVQDPYHREPDYEGDMTPEETSDIPF